MCVWVGGREGNVHLRGIMVDGYMDRYRLDLKTFMFGRFISVGRWREVGGMCI